MSVRQRCRLAVGFGLWLAFLTSRMFAHEPGLSVVEIRSVRGGVDVKLVYAFGDVRRWLPPYSLPAGAENSPESSRAALEALRPLMAGLWEMRGRGGPLEPEAATVELQAGDAVAFHYRYGITAEAPSLEVRSLRLSALSPSHRQLVRVLASNGRLNFETTLTVARVAATIPRAAWAEEGTPAVALAAREFFLLGVEHIWTGYDHLLFLFGLLVVTRSFRSVLVIISCFTLAHSLTLAAATLGWVWLPPALVEPAIAASIVFVGLENLILRGREPRWRGGLTFAFGLVHGFGFASVLRDLGVGSAGAGVAGPLVCFNLGVEAGQICVAAVVLPIMAGIFRSEAHRLRGAAVASVLVSFAGLYWLAERALG